MPFEFNESALRAGLKAAIDTYDPEDDPDSREAFADIISSEVSKAIQPLITLLNTHTHPTSSPGSPTGPPAV
jgi:hypothetical protein